MELNDYINKEREFLHDIATPLMILQGQVDFMAKRFDQMEKEDILKKLGKCQKASEKLTHLLTERRTFVKKLQAELNEK